VRKGLTLIEILISATIFLILSGVLYFLLRTGIFVRERIDLEQDRLQMLCLNLENIAREIRNVVAFTKENTGFKGDSQSIEFYSLLFDYSSSAYQILQIDYEFNGKTLSKTIRHPLTLENIRTFSFFEDLKNFKFYYFDINEKEWKEEWHDEQSLPYAVKIELTYKDKDGDKESSLNKYVTIYR
jgi:prepilin-type N-terminal cleavage/methylation domain-containing protein